MSEGPPFHVVIPARFASSRLPAKALLDLAGKPMVIRVAERARASRAASVCIATDHEEIARAARQHGIPVALTRADHPSGTDRIAEAVEQLGLPDRASVVNVQGDEPLIPPSLIDHVASALERNAMASIATACHPIQELADFLSPHVVKVVLDRDGFALYFSRAPIPFPREACSASAAAAWPTIAMLPADLPVYRHIGIYAYRVAFLRRYASLERSTIEDFEALEQLRALWHGYRIAVATVEEAPPAGVDTPADLERTRRIFEQPSV